MQIRAIYGISIPVIIRHGATQARSALANLRLAAAVQAGLPARLLLELKREGNAYVYGDLVASWQPQTGKAEPAGRLNGVAVYGNRALRHLSIPLPGLRRSGTDPGVLRVQFLEHNSTKVLADAGLTLP